jgi:hypothetical protein
MIVLAALTRLVPHPPNFTAISAMALFGAAYLPSRKLALIVPLAAMLLSDLALEALVQAHVLSGWIAQGRGIYSYMWVVYATTALITVLGFILRNHKSVTVVASMTLLSAVVFFVATNFAMWLIGIETWRTGEVNPLKTAYAPTLAGFLDCYIQALPFFHWTLLGNVVYGGVLFGGFALAERRIPALAQSGQ